MKHNKLWRTSAAAAPRPRERHPDINPKGFCSRCTGWQEVVLMRPDMERWANGNKMEERPCDWDGPGMLKMFC